MFLRTKYNKASGRPSERKVHHLSRTGERIADLEHFYLEVKGIKFSFSAVVKGFRSLSKPRVNWESVSYQITKAYETRPDYIFLLSAKEPVDGVITRFVDYGDSVGNRHLVIFVPPMDVAKLLRWRGII